MIYFKLSCSIFGVHFNLRKNSQPAFLQLLLSSFFLFSYSRLLLNVCWNLSSELLFVIYLYLSMLNLGKFPGIISQHSTFLFVFNIEEYILH